MVQAINNNIEDDIVKEQIKMCNKYRSVYTECPFDILIGIALESFEVFQLPINGLRHPQESEQAINWYIWAGEYSDSESFFKAIHVRHLFEICPKALKFLGLAPGWRFLFD